MRPTDTGFPKYPLLIRIFRLNFQDYSRFVRTRLIFKQFSGSAAIERVLRVAIGTTDEPINAARNPEKGSFHGHSANLGLGEIFTRKTRYRALITN
jgi:hypothetical protein